MRQSPWGERIKDDGGVKKFSICKEDRLKEIIFKKFKPVLNTGVKFGEVFFVLITINNCVMEHWTEDQEVKFVNISYTRMIVIEKPKLTKVEISFIKVKSGTGSQDFFFFFFFVIFFQEVGKQCFQLLYKLLLTIYT